MGDKFVLFGLDDENSKSVAEVIGNKTCKKILNFLGDVKEASEKDISDKLGMPINTVEYNLNKLVKSGLVDKAKNFFWSVKGKKIPMYKLARKHIIISPNKKPDLNYLKSILPVIAVAVVLLLILGIYLYPKENPVVSSDSQIKQFASQEDLNNFLKQSRELAQHISYDSGLFGGISRVFNSVTAPQVAGAKMSAESASDGTDSGSGSSASDYSTTNIQVEGVDEADIVKNDGKYIYVVSGNKVKIIDAYPAEDMRILSEINISGVSNIFINGDKLIVFANDYSAISAYKTTSSEIAVDSAACLGCNRGPMSLVNIYDIGDKENPELVHNLSIEGNYVDSRMINDYVYVVSNKYVDMNNPEPPFYIMDGVAKKAAASDIYYYPYPDTGYVFTSISAINVKDGKINNEVYLTSYTGSIYVSQDNIYLTYQKRVDYNDYADQLAEQVYYPILSDEYDDRIKQVLDSDASNWEKLNEMQSIVKEYGDSLSLKSGKEMSDFSDELMKKLNDFEIKIKKEVEKTVIHKINVDADKIEYKGVGEVPGNVLNQFSMDEYKGYFRIATTTGNTWEGNSLNHLYVLDEDLKIVGSVEDLAEGERIYSARFIGDRAYMVTFKSVDPLFVIDLKDPGNPKVLGYLKIPGYSDYLHPYDENHVIGIGKDVNESIDADKVHSENAVYYTAILGVKVSLFDVTDVEHPIEESKFVIGDRGTETPVSGDHKALLFDKEKELLVLPVSVSELKPSQYSAEMQPETVWQGAYVFKVNLDGIELKGKITHLDSKSKYGPAKDDAVGAIRNIYGQKYVKTAENSWEIDYTGYEYRYYNDVRTVYSDDYMDKQQGGIKDTSKFYDYKTQIQRSLYMGDVLYTISQSRIKANDLESVDEINSLDLGYEDNYYSYPVYKGGIAI
ncbi:MAG: beta-propeller domain-containing protein [Candidatus Nanoarchaeia archaeon]|nr:beta-propeller domain-containing protein [Candidatus Nanoarchaeia archaeon]MDD5741029.1 beta-propeller domain-containing protein [Candidatus Nanoarchaeia archaeon]